MPRSIRLHLDESSGMKAIATALRRAGADVSTSVSAGLRGAADKMELAFADGEYRVLFTQDSDFLALHASGKPHAGIV